MRKFILLGLLLVISQSAIAQNMFVNMGLYDNGEFSGFVGGVLFDNIDIDIMFASPEIEGDDSNSAYGGKLGYMIYLLDEFDTGVYVGPHVGGYFLDRNNFDENLIDESETEFSLNYGLTIGAFIDKFHVSFGYGVDDLFETEYYTFKVGFNFITY